MIWDQWEARWRAALAACDRLGGDARELKIGKPASEREVAAVEAQLQLRLPSSFRKVLTQFAADVEFWWFLPDDMELPAPLVPIFGSVCRWSLDDLVKIEAGRKSWIDCCFPNIDDDYDRVWHNKLAFLEVGNGDMLALDLALSPEPVVYLSHDDAKGHGYRLGADFADFIDRWTLLGCPGAEDWQMLPFISSPTSMLDPYGKNAELWRSIFGLTFAP